MFGVFKENKYINKTPTITQKLIIVIAVTIFDSVMIEDRKTERQLNIKKVIMPIKRNSNIVVQLIRFKITTTILRIKKGMKNNK